MRRPNVSFIKDHILEAEQLMELKRKIDEIVDFITGIENGSHDGGSSGGVSIDDVDDAILAAKDELMSLIEELLSSIGDIIETVNGLEDGSYTIDNEEEFLKAIKLQCNTVLLDLNLAKEENGEIKPSINLAVISTLRNDLDNLQTQYAGLIALLGKVGLIANHFDENGDPIYNGALIIASINDAGNSTAGINADKIVLNGEILASYLNSNYISVGSGASEFNSNGSGHIANGNIVWDTNGNVTISGDFTVGNKTVKFLTEEDAEYIDINMTVPGVSSIGGREVIVCNGTITNRNNFDFYTTVYCEYEQEQGGASGTGLSDYIYLGRSGSNDDQKSVQIIMEKPAGWDNGLSIDTYSTGLRGAYRYIQRQN